MILIVRDVQRYLELKNKYFPSLTGALIPITAAKSPKFCRGLSMQLNLEITPFSIYEINILVEQLTLFQPMRLMVTQLRQLQFWHACPSYPQKSQLRVHLRHLLRQELQ